jgi:hypothetical protein
MIVKNIRTTVLSLCFIFSNLLLDSAFAYRQDPFEPLPAQEATEGAQTYTLEMILITDNNRSAVINHQLVHEGDLINKAVVLHITEKCVIISKAGSDIKLSIVQEGAESCVK